MISGYLRYRRAMLCAVFVACVCFTSVMLLVRTNGEFIVYANLLYLFIVAVFVSFDVYKYQSKLKALTEISENLTTTLHDFPEWENNIERLYSDIIASLYELMDDERKDITSQYGEQVDYYTMWLHQIKTPISAMRLAIENDGGANPIYEQELFKIERYVEMALQYLKIKNLENDLVLESCDVDAVIRQCVKKYKTPFIYKKLSVDIRDTQLVRVCDRKWLSFIVEQLLSNAVKYTDVGGISIYPVQGGFAVEDSGIGIRKEDIERIFEKGYTGFNGRIDNRASGLGLFMAAKAAKRLGIELNACSDVGRGTVMTVRFKANE